MARSGWPARWDRMILQGRDWELGKKGREYLFSKFRADYDVEEGPYDEEPPEGGYGDDDWSDPAEA